MKKLTKYFCLLLIQNACISAASAAAVAVTRPDYRQVSDSPWIEDINDGNVYVEDFTQNIPAICAGPSPYVFISPFISSPAGRWGTCSGAYSVDGDDGIIDDFGRFGGSYVLGGTQAPDGTAVSFRFDFARNSLGDLPSRVGLVVTLASTRPVAGGGVTINIFGSGGDRLASLTSNDYPESLYVGSPASRMYYTNGALFLGFEGESEISSLTVSNGIAVDHVQYSFDRIPEPGVAALVVAAGGWMCGRRRRAGMW